MEKLGIIYKLQPSLLKKEMEHDETYEDTWEAEEDEWLPYVKNDLYSTVFCYDRYTMRLDELTNIGMKNSLTLPSLLISILVLQVKTTNQFTHTPIL